MLFPYGNAPENSLSTTPSRLATFGSQTLRSTGSGRHVKSSMSASRRRYGYAHDKVFSQSVPPRSSRPHGVHRSLDSLFLNSTSRSSSPATFVTCEVCATAVLESSYEWHLQKCTQQSEERKRRRWLDSTRTPSLIKERSHKSWIPAKEDISTTLQFSIDNTHVKKRPKFVKCEECGAFVNETGLEFHAKKCAAKSSNPKAEPGMKYITGYFYRSPLELSGDPGRFSVSTCAYRSWWHELPKAKANSNSSMKTQQCPNCAAVVLNNSFEIHKKKCKARIGNAEAEIIHSKWQKVKVRREQREARERKVREKMMQLTETGTAKNSTGKKEM